MMIRVIYNDKRTALVADHRLEELIASGRIVAFYRAGEWVSVARDPIRGKGGATSYTGAERRKNAEKPQNSENYYG